MSDTLRAGSLTEYLDLVLQHFSTHFENKVIFFRGMASSDHRLLPSVFRENFPESDFAHNFRAQAATSADMPDHNELDRWLFVMQHHGLPTRLLDWSESPLVALHFAIYENELDTDACVYLLDPIRLNKKALGGAWFPDRNDPNYKYRFLKAFYRNPEALPWPQDVDFDRLQNRDLPLAIRPIITHQRMVTQKAAFTVQGDEHVDIRTLVAQFSRPKRYLSRIIIPADRKQLIDMQLKQAGITRSSIFPDLDGVANDIKSRSRVRMQLDQRDGD